MRTFVSFFLFLLFASQIFSSFAIDGMYWLNKNYVAQTLCENKDKPQLHCDGKCYLSKQIAKDSKDAALPSSNKKERGDEVYFYPVTAFFITQNPVADVPAYADSPAIFFSSYHASLLRPPQIFFV